MHILILPSEYYVPKDRPTAGVFQQDHARLFKSKGHKVGVISIKPKFSWADLIHRSKKNLLNKSFLTVLDNWLEFLVSAIIPLKFLLRQELIEQIPVIRYTGSYIIQKHKNTLEKRDYNIKIGRAALRKYISRYGEPDIIHAHNVLYAGDTALHLSEEFGIPFVLTERSSAHFMGNPDALAIEVIQSVFKKTKQLNCVSPAFGRMLEKKYNLKRGSFKWMPNMMDSIFNQDEFFKGALDRFTFLNVANLIPLKGQVELIKAFYKEFSHLDNVYLKIGGKGPSEKKLRELIARLELEDKVELCGYLTRKQVMEEMQKCNVFVFPSHFETFGVVLIEAAALGKPLIASSCGGPECIVNNINGVLVEPKNIEALSIAMIKMYNNFDNYKSEEIKGDIERRFSKEAFYLQAMELYESSISEFKEFN